MVPSDENGAHGAAENSGSRESGPVRGAGRGGQPRPRSGVRTPTEASRRRPERVRTAGAYLQSCLGLGMYPGYASSVIILHILLSRSEGRRVPDLTRRPRQWSKVLRSSGPSSVKKQWPKEL